MSATAVHGEPGLHMGLPMPNGKTAMWMFLVTEIMFFTGLIGAYIVLRNSAPDRYLDPATGAVVKPSSESEKDRLAHVKWPGPHDVHLEELYGAVNTIVLIGSSVTIVLAHFYLGRGRTGLAVGFIGVTLALGCLFMAIKAVEYTAKFDHGILPGRMGDHLEHSDVGYWYKDTIRDQLRPIVEGRVTVSAKSKEEAEKLYKHLDGDATHPALTPIQVGKEVNELIHHHEDLHLSPYVPYGNMWASCYFAMTGFHAIHVLGGLVIFVIMLCMAASGNFGPQHESFVELTGLYWHFVDVVWIFLFPLLYLV